MAENEKPKMTTKEHQAVGFIPGLHKFDATECMILNEQLAARLAGMTPFSTDWYAVAKEFHKHARSTLRCCG